MVSGYVWCPSLSIFSEIREMSRKADSEAKTKETNAKNFERIEQRVSALQAASRLWVLYKQQAASECFTSSG